MRAEVGRFERFFFLNFSFSLSGVLFLFWGHKFFGVFETYRYLLENLNVMFSTDTVTLCLNVS